MAEFKEFQLENGEPVAINIDHVIYCVPDGEGTRLVFADDSAMNVQTAFKQVFKHLPQERTDSFGKRVS